MKRLLFISVVFVALAILYFSTVQCPSKLAYPVAFLALMALIDYKHIGIWMVYGLVFSALGDWQGTQGNFFRQMALFGLAHIAYICYFASRLENKDNEKAGWATWLCVLIGVAAYIKVVPMVPSGTLRSGVIVYCLLILAMLRMALMLLGASWFLIMVPNGYFFSGLHALHQALAHVPHRDNDGEGSNYQNCDENQQYVREMHTHWIGFYNKVVAHRNDAEMMLHQAE